MQIKSYRVHTPWPHNTHPTHTPTPPIKTTWSKIYMPMCIILHFQVPHYHAFSSAYYTYQINTVWSEKYTQVPKYKHTPIHHTPTFSTIRSLSHNFNIFTNVNKYHVKLSKCNVRNQSTFTCCLPKITLYMTIQHSKKIKFISFNIKYYFSKIAGKKPKITWQCYFCTIVHFMR